MIKVEFEGKSDHLLLTLKVPVMVFTCDVSTKLNWRKVSELKLVIDAWLNNYQLEPLKSDLKNHNDNEGENGPII